MLSRRTEAGTQGRRVQLRLTLVTGQRSRSLVVPPVALAILGGLLPLAGLIFVAATCYFIFHDDLLAGLTRRQIAMQYSYEARLARLRHEVTNLTQHAKINEAELAERLGTLTRQQGELENRTVLVAHLAERARALHGAAGTEPAAKPEVAAGADPLPTGAFAPELPPATSAYAPLGSFPTGRPVSRLSEPKPQPEGFELRLDDGPGPRPHAGPEGAVRARSVSKRPAISPLSFDEDLLLATKLDRLAARQDRLDHAQLIILAHLQEPAKRISARIRAAFISAGLTPDRLRQPPGARPAATGGPFVPLPSFFPDSSAFARAATEAQTTIATAEKLRLIAMHVPFASPVPGPIEITSPFGPRIDPFLGRPALHTGVDLGEDYGSPVRATADGTVVFADADGGYGNLVEIDHGNGLSSRYAHLSSFAVRQGQKVTAGTVVGHIGESGRATGPHLHYETRIDGEPVDPERFLKAGTLLRTALAGSDL